MNLGIELLRGLAAFGIVGCHLSLPCRTAAGRSATSLCDMNVAVFAALSGMMMYFSLKRKSDLAWKDYALKRVIRLLPVYLAWTAIFLFATVMFDLLIDGGRINPTYKTAEFWLNVVLLGGAATHLWFLAWLFYAQVSLFGLFKQIGKSKAMAWILLLVGGVIVTMAAVISGRWGNYPVRLFGFVISGFALGRLIDGGLKIKSCCVSWCCLGVALCAHVMLGTKVHGFVKDWFVVCLVVPLFYSVEIVKASKFAKVAVWLGATSMGVYLIHPLATRAISVVVERVFAPPVGVAVVVGEWVLAWVLAVVVTVAFRRMPVLKRIV